jgi:hypothetical protein
MTKLSITHMEIEHCNQCSHCRGVRRFKCALTNEEVNLLQLHRNCPLPDKERVK